MNIVGLAMERKTAKALSVYFKGMKNSVVGRLSQVKADSKDLARAKALHLVIPVIRKFRPTLLHILETMIAEAMLKADRLTVMHEADDETAGGFTDTKSGLTAEEAAVYAQEEAAKRVVGIDEMTAAMFADAVAEAIAEEKGVAGLSRSLRQITDEMSKSRADTIARTEMADAFGEASLRKLNREGIEWKQIILSPGACPICESIFESGPVPVDDPFVDEDGEEYDRTPIHVNCRCATVGARAPVGE